MSLVKNLIYTARLRTLPLSLSCVIVAGAISYSLEAFNPFIFGLNLLTILLLQILSNFANDLGDGEKGTDNADRIGPKRAVQSGLITLKAMKRYVKILIALTFVSGIALLFIANLFWYQKATLFAIGIAAIWAAYAYTNGKKAYGYSGFGDLFVFLFFGIVGVCGSLFLYTHCLNNASLLPAIGVGLLATSVLHLNNMRDRVNDLKCNKHTLAIKLGNENSKLYFLFLLLIGTVCWGSFVFCQTLVNWVSYIYWIGFLPLLVVLFKFFRTKNERDYDRLLKPTALSVFITALLFFIAQIF